MPEARDRRAGHQGKKGNMKTILAQALKRKEKERISAIYL